jgi:hypothetical protein
MAGQKLWRPGQIAPKSGVALIVNQNGVPTGKTRRITGNKPFPPTPHKGQRYRPK